MRSDTPRADEMTDTIIAVLLAVLDRAGLRAHVDEHVVRERVRAAAHS